MAYPPDGTNRPALLHSRLDVIETVADLPILALDATMPEPVVRHYLPRLDVLANVQPHAPHMTANQILGGCGKASLIPSDRAAPDENTRRIGVGDELTDFVRLNSGGNGLLITYQDLEDQFAELGIQTGYFNAISGLNTFGDVRSLFVIGRPLPAPSELFTIARALTGETNSMRPGHSGLICCPGDEIICCPGDEIRRASLGYARSAGVDTGALTD